VLSLVELRSTKMTFYRQLQVHGCLEQQGQSQRILERLAECAHVPKSAEERGVRQVREVIGGTDGRQPETAAGLAKVVTWNRRYDHNFRRFSTIFGEKIGVFLKKQCYDQIFA
jgi:hypothetical protein